MKWKLGLLLITLLFLLAACGQKYMKTAGSSPPSSPPSSQQSERIFSLADVNEAFKKEGLELKDAGSISNIVLLGQQATVDMFDNGFLSIYVFKTSSEIQLAEQEFYKQLEPYHVVNPKSRIYMVDNVLMYYGKEEFSHVPFPRDARLEAVLKRMKKT